MTDHSFKKINSSEFSKYLKGSKHTYMSSGYFVMQPRFGMATFNFKQFGASHCVLKIKRNTGNGVILFVSDGKSENVQITSKNQQYITVPIGKDGEVQIHRTNRSRGEISIIDIELFAAVEEKDWNSIIKKCESHYCLKLIGNTLHASEGGYIIGKGISVKTDPPFCYTQTDEKVIFKSACQIIDLEVTGKVKKKEPIIQSMPETPKEKPVKIEEPRMKRAPTSVDIKPPPVLEKTTALFDSSKIGFSPSNCNQYARASISGVVLDFKGSYTISIGKLKPNFKYKLNVGISKVDGNGKFMYGLLPNSGSKSELKIASSPKSFSLGFTADGGVSYSIGIWRHPSSRGRVLLSSLQLVEIGPVPKKSIEPQLDQINAITPLDVYDSDNVTKISKKFSTFEFSSKKVNPIFKEKKIAVTSYSGMKWLKLVSYRMGDIVISDDADFSIGTINSFVPAKKLYLDSFSSVEITNTAIEKLKSVDTIYTSSDQSTFEIMSKLPKAKVVTTSMMWPYTDPKEVVPLKGKDFFVVTNRNKVITRHLLSCLGDKKVVVLGARGSYDKNVFPTNEYLPYSNLIWILKNAKAVFDFHDIEDHKSGLDNLIVNLGTPLITNSWEYMDNPSVIFLNTPNDVQGVRVPEHSDVKESINDLNSLKENPSIDKYIEDFNKFISDTFQ